MLMQICSMRNALLLTAGLWVSGSLSSSQQSVRSAVSTQPLRIQ